MKRLVAQSIAFVYAPGEGPRTESDPLNPDPAAATTVDAVRALEEAALSLSEGIVLRYGLLYGPGTWSPDKPIRPPSIHVAAAAQACLRALERGRPGIYNLAEDDGYCSSDKAKRDFGFDAAFRV